MCNISETNLYFEQFFISNVSTKIIVNKYILVMKNVFYNNVVFQCCELNIIFMFLHSRSFYLLLSLLSIFVATNFAIQK